MIEGVLFAIYAFISSIIPGMFENLLLFTYYTLFNALH
jgi:hypothetical protein